MMARLLQTAALSAALFALPALASSHHRAKHHVVRRHAGRSARLHHSEIAKADPQPASAPAAAPSEDGSSDGARHVVTHSIYDPSADKAE